MDMTWAGNRLSNTISIQGLNSDGSPQVDQNGNPVLSSRTEQYGYDELSRLTSVDYGDGESQGYGFDPMGIRLQKTDTVNNVTTTEGYSYNNANMLLSRNSDNYVSDAAGNTLTGGGRTNTWDSENRLTQCVSNGTTSSFVYGADGLRRQMSVTSGGTTTTTNFALDGDSVVREMREISGVLAPTSTYFLGPQGPLYRRDDLSGSLRWYVFDGLGSVVGEVDPSGNLTCNRGYDVYGATRSSTGTPTSKHGFVGQLGHPTDDETGLEYMRARYYDPAAGRFLSEDPDAQGTDWYIYAGDNPVGNVDRSGKSWPGVFEGVLGSFIFKLLEPVLAIPTIAAGNSLIAWGKAMINGGSAQVSVSYTQMKMAQLAEMGEELTEAAMPTALAAPGAGNLVQYSSGTNIIAGVLRVVIGEAISQVGWLLQTCGNRMSTDD